MIRSFVAAEDGLRSMEVALNAYESARRQEPVACPDRLPAAADAVDPLVAGAPNRNGTTSDGRRSPAETGAPGARAEELVAEPGGDAQ